jgi:site-specific DNA-methyltransferase (adenine-specific)
MISPTFNRDRVTLYNADVFDFLDAFGADTLDAVVTDPPYSSGGMFRADRIATTRDKYVHGETKNVRADFSGDNRDQRSFLP